MHTQPIHDNLLLIVVATVCMSATLLCAHAGKSISLSKGSEAPVARAENSSLSTLVPQNPKIDTAVIADGVVMLQFAPVFNDNDGTTSVYQAYVSESEDCPMDTIISVQQSGCCKNSEGKCQDWSTHQTLHCHGLKVGLVYTVNVIVKSPLKADGLYEPAPIEVVHTEMVAVSKNDVSDMTQSEFSTVVNGVIEHLEDQELQASGSIGLATPVDMPQSNQHIESQRRTRSLKANSQRRLLPESRHFRQNVSSSLPTDFSSRLVCIWIVGVGLLILSSVLIAFVIHRRRHPHPNTHDESLSALVNANYSSILDTYSSSDDLLAESRRLDTNDESPSDQQ